MNRSKEITFYFEGKPIVAYEGETIASALYASGVRVFSRSFKYHRPRGLLCVSEKCPNCLMNVDGAPNVRACVEPVKEGVKVRHQNAWPSLTFDLLSILDKFDRLMPVGFYYKTFIHPRFVWPLAERIIKRIAGLGEIHIQSGHERTYEHQYVHTDICVVGGGPAGLTAALEASRLGMRVALVDDQPLLGGHLRIQTRRYENLPTYGGLRGYEIAQKLTERVESDRKITVLKGATAFGFYEGNLLGIMQHKRLIKLRTKRVIIATGAFERPLVFHNNDLPGIFLGSGAQRLIQLYRIKPGNKALVVTNNDYGLAVADDLVEAGIQVVAVADARESHTTNELRSLSSKTEILLSHTIKEARGSKHVSGAVIVALDKDGNPVPGSEREVTCDFICLSIGFEPANALLYQSGCKLQFDPILGEFRPADMSEGIYAAGDVTGVHSLEISLLQGKIAGMEAALSLQARIPTIAGASHGNPAELEPVSIAVPRDDGELVTLRQKLLDLEQKYRSSLGARVLTAIPDPRKKKFVCICEDVTEKDLCTSIEEGFDEIETLKRYSTFSMGPCQGKMCSTAIGICARQTGRTVGGTGTTTARPPIHPVTIGALAGKELHPVKLTAIHHKHVQLGARLMDMGEWKRPHTYTTPEDECRAVHERVGLIDVSTLGRLDVKGKDAAKLLDKVYTHSFSTLKVGRVRYGVICDDGGIILDDGTVSRLAEDHFFITTTTGNIEFVEQWMKWWAAGTGMCVHVTNVTSGFAAVNLAGPKARDVLAKLTTINLSSTAFPYMACVQAQVAGVPTVLLRIGFVGEMGWEMHFPAEYGEYVWQTIMDAGKEFGIAPFGVEAQRILRLEKKHVIVGVDTDALSNPLESDMAWVVKLEKDDFIGKHGLIEAQARGFRQKLVGFILRDGAVAEDGNAIVWNGRVVGRVTSSRFSYLRGECVGMAWVPVELAKEGAEIQIVTKGQAHRAQVFGQPFYDPEGKRLRA